MVWSEHSFNQDHTTPKRRLATHRRRGLTQKKVYYIFQKVSSACEALCQGSELRRLFDCCGNLMWSPSEGWYLCECVWLLNCAVCFWPHPFGRCLSFICKVDVMWNFTTYVTIASGLRILGRSAFLHIFSFIGLFCVQCWLKPKYIFWNIQWVGEFLIPGLDMGPHTPHALF
jgi:hypothetical protein